MGNPRKPTPASVTTTRNTEKTPSEGFSLISDDKLIALYASLIKCRSVAQRLTAPNSHSTNGDHPWMRRFEAGAVGLTIDLQPEDAVCSPDHGIVTGFRREPPLEALLHFSKANGSLRQSSIQSKSNPRGRNGIKPAVHLSHTQAAVGTALANKTRKNGKVAIVFGDARSSAWSEALQIAAVHALPMIFVSREGASRTPAARKPRAGKAKQPSRLEVPWFPDITVDCNDVVAVYRVANEAISRARLGRGPTLIECRPFLLDGKATGSPDFNGNGRHTRNPISNMETYLRGRGLLRAGMRREIVAKFARELDTLLGAKNDALRAKR